MNTSIFNAFERMWQHITSALSNKSDISHNHKNDYDAIGSASTALDSAKSYTDTKVYGLASTSVVDNKISSHNTSTSAHNDIRDLITGLTTRLNALMDSNDTTLDQMSEIVAYIKNNKSLIDSITTNKVNVSDIINNLTTNVSNKALSAAQGVALKSLIDAIDVPTKLPNPNTLTINGTTYDGSNAVNMTNVINSLIDSKLATIINAEEVAF